MMKRRVCTLLAVFLLLNGLAASAYATEVEVIDTCTPALSRTVAPITLDSTTSVGLSCSIAEGDTITSDYTYITTTGNIVICGKGTSSTTFKVKLYTSSGTLAATKSGISISTSSTTITFSQLSTSTAYYFTIENTGSANTSFSGTIKSA